MDRMTATEVLLETYPSMAEDKELMPLMRRMMIIEKLLATNPRAMLTRTDLSTFIIRSTVVHSRMCL